MRRRRPDDFAAFILPVAARQNPDCHWLAGFGDLRGKTPAATLVNLTLELVGLSQQVRLRQRAQEKRALNQIPLGGGATRRGTGQCLAQRFASTGFQRLVRGKRRNRNARRSNIRTAEVDDKRRVGCDLNRIVEQPDGGLQLAVGRKFPQILHADDRQTHHITRLPAVRLGVMEHRFGFLAIGFEQCGEHDVAGIPLSFPGGFLHLIGGFGWHDFKADSGEPRVGERKYEGRAVPRLAIERNCRIRLDCEIRRGDGICIFQLERHLGCRCEPPIGKLL